MSSSSNKPSSSREESTGPEGQIKDALERKDVLGALEIIALNSWLVVSAIKAPFDDIPDILQDTFAAVCRYFHECKKAKRQIDQPVHLVRAIARRKTADFLRIKYRRRERETAVDPSIIDGIPEDDIPEDLNEFMDKDRKWDLVSKALAEIKTSQPQEAFSIWCHLSKGERKPRLADLAEAMSISEEAAKKNLQRGRQAVKARISQYDGEK